MALQTSFSIAHDVGIPGMLADTGPKEIISGLYAPRKLVSVAITAVNSAHYIVTITIGGVAVAYDYTADGSATTAEITAGLVALINAGTQPVHATGTDTPLVVEATADKDFSATYNANMVETVLVASGASATASADGLTDYGAPVPAGVLLVVDDRAPSTRSQNQRPVRLPRVIADITGVVDCGVAIETRSSELAGYRGRHMVPLMLRGRIWVFVEQAVLAGDQAFVRYSANGAGKLQLGAFRKDDDSTHAAALPYARFATASYTTSNYGLLAQLEKRA